MNEDFKIFLTDSHIKEEDYINASFEVKVKLQEAFTISRPKVAPQPVTGITEEQINFIVEKLATIEKGQNNVQKELTVLKEDVQKELTVLQEELTKELGILQVGVKHVLSFTNDPWEHIHSEQSEVVKENSKKHLKDVSDFYETPQSHYCMMLGPFTTHCSIICSHIWPNHTFGQGLELLDLSHTDVHSPRNFLRLHKSIEYAFDHKYITFIPSDCPPDNAPAGSICLKMIVLNPKLFDRTSSEGWFKASQKHIYFADLHDKNMNYVFVQGKQPFLHILAQHASNSFTSAYGYDWIKDEQDFLSKKERVIDLVRRSLGFVEESNNMQSFLRNI